MSDPVVSVLQVPPMGLFYPSLLSLEEFSPLSRPWSVFLIPYFCIADFILFFVGCLHGLLFFTIYPQFPLVKCSDLKPGSAHALDDGAPIAGFT